MHIQLIVGNRKFKYTCNLYKSVRSMLPSYAIDWNVINIHLCTSGKKYVGHINKYQVVKWKSL